MEELEPTISDVYQIDGKDKLIAFTDNKGVGDTLVIRTDGERYLNWCGVIGVTYTVTNVSGNDQIVKTVFSLKSDPNRKIRKILIHGGEEIVEKKIPIYDLTSGSTIPIRYETKKIERTKWLPLEKKGFDVNTDSFVRRSIGDNVPNEYGEVLIKAGETKIFKTEVDFRGARGSTDEEKFFIEAFGDKGAYGHLDPWTYEQNFNTLNTANLDGQDDWSESTAGCYTVQEDETYEGAKAVKVIPTSGGWRTASRDVTGSTAGSMYMAVNSGGINDLTTYLGDTTGGMGYEFEISFNYTTNNIGLGTSEDGWHAETFDTFVDGEWGVINIEWDDTAQPDKYRARYHDGTSWGSFSDWYTGQSSYATIDQMQIHSQLRGASTPNYFDTITATDPTAATATGNFFLMF